MRILGNRLLRLWTIDSNSLCKCRAWAGNAPYWFGCLSACLIQATSTCWLVTPALVSRCCSVVQVVAVGLTQASAASPPWAPSTTNNCGFLLLSASARTLKELVVEPNSC